MNKLIDHIKSFSFFILIVVVILLLSIYWLYDSENVKKLHTTGKHTIAYVYETTNSGRSNSSDAWYYFYSEGILKKDYCNVPENIYSLNKFFIVYYIPDDPKNSILDFRREIPRDSVANYFPEEKNPFRFLLGK